jgi:hypothetical protein
LHALSIANTSSAGEKHDITSSSGNRGHARAVLATIHIGPSSRPSTIDNRSIIGDYIVRHRLSLKQSKLLAAMITSSSSSEEDDSDLQVSCLLSSRIRA